MSTAYFKVECVPETGTGGIIEVRNLSKSYFSGRGATQAIDRVDLQIREGEFVAILGPSGCGKSTLLSVLGLLERPDCGEYWLAGAKVTSLGFNQSADVRNRHVGFIFQAFNLVADLTVWDNVMLPLRYSRAIPKEEHRDKALQYLERVGLSERIRDFPSQLSGGEQQRVAIARAMVTDPSIVLADEPTGNLDSRNAKEVMVLLRDLNDEGATIVLVTHDESLTQFANRCVHMKDGRILEDSHVERY
jgi:putative ABC transport system ATP-binding protein